MYYLIIPVFFDNETLFQFCLYYKSEREISMSIIEIENKIEKNYSSHYLIDTFERENKCAIKFFN